MRSPLPRGSRFAQFARFACVGVSNTVLSYVVYAALVSAGVPYVPAGAIAFAAGAVNGYRLNRRWTFRASDSTRRRLRYLVVQFVSLGATTNLLWLFVSVAGVHRLAGYLLTIPAVTVASFAANRAWTFVGATLEVAHGEGDDSEGDHKGRPYSYRVDATRGVDV